MGGQTDPHGSRAPRVTVVVCLAALYLIWGSTYLGIRYAIAGFPPYMMGAIRFLIAGGGLWVVLHGRSQKSPTIQEWRNSVVLGALMLVMGFGGVTFAEQYVSSGLAALAVGAMPLWAALFGGIWGIWPGRLEAMGLAVGFSGLVVLNLEGSLRASPIGAIVLLASPACWAFGSVCSRRLRLPAGLMGSAAEMLSGGVLLMLVSVVRGERLDHIPSTQSVFALAYLIVFGSVVAFSAYLYLLARVRPALATSYAYVNPVVAVAVGAVIAGEKVTGAVLVAMPIILAGVVIVLISHERQTGPAK